MAEEWSANTFSVTAAQQSLLQYQPQEHRLVPPSPLTLGLQVDHVDGGTRADEQPLAISAEPDPTWNGRGHVRPAAQQRL